jgi:hypothetical protein
MGLLDDIANLVDRSGTRRQQKEIERDLEARRGKLKIQQHIKKQQEMSKKLWELGKRATQLGETRQFQQIGKQYLWTMEDIKRWERYLLSFEAIEARRDQARSYAEFMRAANAMSKSMLSNANPKEFAKMQADLELGLARAQGVEQTMDYLMDVTDQTVFSSEELSDSEMDASLREIERTMQEESKVAASDSNARVDLDARIAEGLRKIEGEMKKNK